MGRVKREPEVIIIEPDITPEENERRYKLFLEALQPIVDEICEGTEYTGIHFGAM